MAEVSITVNGRSYSVSCEDGQEDRLKRLGKYLDNQVGKLSGQLGQIGDLRLMLMAGLLVADELAEAQEKLTRAEREYGKLEKRLAQTSDKAKAAEADAAEAVDAAAERIEAAVARIAGAG